MAHSSERTIELYKYFFSSYPRRTIFMVLLMALAGLAEGIGVVSLVPVLEFAGATGEPQSRIGEFVVGAIESVGLTPSLGVMLSAIIVAIGLKAAFLWVAQQQVGFTVAEVTRDMRLRMLRALLDVRWEYFGDRTLGQFANAISTEAGRSSAAYREACQLTAAVLQMIPYFVVAALLNWKVTVGAVGVGLLLAVFFQRFVRSSKAAGRAQTKLNKSLTSRIIDVLQGIKPLKAMARQDLVWPLLHADTEGLNQAQRKQVSASQGLKAFQEPILAIFLAGGLYAVISLSDQRLPEILALAFVFYRLMQHINTLQVRLQVMAVGESAFFSFRDELELALREHETWGGTVKPGPLSDRLQFEDVSFSYGHHKVLDQVNLVLPAGAFVAITGESGSGKTTLADLVAGLYTPDEGRILVDGVPLTEIDLEAWRSEIGYVPQEMLLFDGTIYENVTLRDEELTREDAERALRAAGAWEFVQDKEKGLDTPIGERGGMLSGGQRQRIAIARALVTRPSLLILDEVTSALDPATEQAICTTLQGLGDVTVLSISHQPAMREAADLSYSMRAGRLEPERMEAAAAPSV